MRLGMNWRLECWVPISPMNEDIFSISFSSFSLLDAFQNFPSFKYFVLSRGDVSSLLLIGQECQKGVEGSEELGSGI